jgi:hypothetical protein
MADQESRRLDLERAQRHLEAAEMGIAMTRRTIAQLERNGRPIDDALRTLERLQHVIETMTSYRRAVLRAVDAQPAAARALPPAAINLPAVSASCRVPIPAPSHSSAAAGPSS